MIYSIPALLRAEQEEKERLERDVARLEFEQDAGSRQVDSAMHDDTPIDEPPRKSKYVLREVMLLDGDANTAKWLRIKVRSLPRTCFLSLTYHSTC